MVGAGRRLHARSARGGRALHQHREPHGVRATRALRRPSEPRAVARDRMEGDGAAHVDLQAAPRRQVPRRHALHRRRRRVLVRPLARVGLDLQALREPGGQREEDRRLHGGVHHAGAESGDGGDGDEHPHHEPRMVREAPHDEAAGFRAQRGDVLRAPHDGHRPVRPREIRGRREERLSEEPRVVGRRRGPLQRQHRYRGVPPHRESRHAHGGARLGPGRFRARSAGAGRAAPHEGSPAQGMDRRREPRDLPRPRPRARPAPVLRREGHAIPSRTGACAWRCTRRSTSRRSSAR